MSRLSFSAIALAALCTLSAPSAMAFFGPGPTNVAVVDHVSHDGVWTFDYSLTNNTSCVGNCGDTLQHLPIMSYWLGVREFAVPYFSDAGINHISAPTGWSWEVVSTDMFHLGSGASALVWTAAADDARIAMNATLGGFGYDANYGPGKGPFSATNGLGDTMLGDPAIPLSPDAAAAGILPTSPVPEPESYLMVLAGIAVVAGSRRARRSAGVASQA